MVRMESPDENYERVSARLSGSRRERFNQHLDENDVSKSAVIRRGIDLVTNSAVEIGRPSGETDEIPAAGEIRKEPWYALGGVLVGYFIGTLL